MGFLVGGILTHGLHKGGITHIVGTRLLTRTSLFEIETVASTPLPGVVQVEHGHHLALTHLLKQVVKSGKDGIIVHTRCFLKRRLHLRLHPALTVRAHKNTEVVYADGLHIVELPGETFTVATLPLGGQDRTIPEVGPDIVVGLAIFYKMTILHSHEVLRNLLLLLASHQDDCQNDCY